MAERNILDIMREGQEKSLEAMALLKKQMAGTITPDETVRLAMLNGNLLGLVEQAQAQGIGVAVGTGLGQVPTEDNDSELDEDLFGFDEDIEDERPRVW